MSHTELKSQSSISENYFEDHYPPLPLPMIWRVIYHEAARGNHLLWDRQDLADVESTLSSKSMSIDASDKIQLTKFMALFLSTGNFQELQAMLKGCSQRQKALVFIMYKRALSTWRMWLKNNLN